jgi:hypothetical protein
MAALRRKVKRIDIRALRLGVVARDVFKNTFETAS